MTVIGTTPALDKRLTILNELMENFFQVIKALNAPGVEQSSKIDLSIRKNRVISLRRLNTSPPTKA
jgi:hypothetical protein